LAHAVLQPEKDRRKVCSTSEDKFQWHVCVVRFAAEPRPRQQRRSCARFEATDGAGKALRGCPKSSRQSTSVALRNLPRPHIDITPLLSCKEPISRQTNPHAEFFNTTSLLRTCNLTAPVWYARKRVFQTTTNALATFLDKLVGGRVGIEESIRLAGTQSRQIAADNAQLDENRGLIPVDVLRTYLVPFE
jgi:hypothetical protein